MYVINKTVQQRSTIKSVTVEAPENEDENAVFEFALEALGETRGSIFGHTIRYYDDPAEGCWVVKVHTD